MGSRTSRMGIQGRRGPEVPEAVTEAFSNVAGSAELDGKFSWALEQFRLIRPWRMGRV